MGACAFKGQRTCAVFSRGSSIGNLEEDAQAWNRVWCLYPRAWKGLVGKFVTVSLSFEKQQDCESEKTGALEEAGSPRVEY